MENIINRITGASIALHPSGNRLKLVIEGTASQVEQATNLLYNFHAITELPEWYEPSFTYCEFYVTRKHFIRGLVALCLYHGTSERDKAKGRIASGFAKCMQAIIGAAHYFKAITVQPQSKPSATYICDLSALSDSEPMTA